MKIKFVPQNIEIEGDPNKTLLQLATENNIPIKSICNGVPSCAECRVRIIEGDHVIPPPNQSEINLIGSSYFLDGRRLSCQVRCLGSMTVDLTEQVGKVDLVKKVKGVRLREPREIQAKQDTLILTTNNADKKPQQK
jgi:ferredoxin, 2Fe-2S